MIPSAILLMDWLNCTEGGTNDSISNSIDLLYFLDFQPICASEPD